MTRNGVEFRNICVKLEYKVKLYKKSNPSLLKIYAQVNEAPYEAWLIKVSEVSDTEELLDADGYAAVVAAEEG